MLLYTGFINTTNNFRLRIAYNQTRAISQIDGHLWLQFIASAAPGNGSSTAAQFPVSSQKPSYDFNLKKGCFKPIVCLNILA